MATRRKKISHFEQRDFIYAPPLKYPPKKCSTPRRICIRCQKTVIHKNDPRFDSRLCRSCVPPGTSITP